MKTVVGNNAGLDKHYPLLDVRENDPVNELVQGRSCFYDFGARSSVEFTGFVDEGDSELIDKIGDYFRL